MKNIKDGVALILIFAAGIVGENIEAAAIIGIAAILQSDKIVALIRR